MGHEEITFESFNAKNIPNEAISKSFISNEEFFQIAQNNHTLIMGPRGCGKTTMLKMLTTPALHNWRTKNDREQNLRQHLPFISIYIPADEIWQEQFREMEDSLSKYPLQWQRIREAIFTTNVHISFVKSIREYTSIKQNENSIEKESAICDAIKRSFQLKETAIPTLKTIQTELEFRFSDIFIKYKRIIDLGESDFDDFYRIDFIKSLLPVITEFESNYNINSSTRWALCFDELELVPKDIFIRLLRYLRAVPQKILFKLSTAPTLSFDLFESSSDSPNAKKDHDYDNVTMWPDTSEKSSRYRIFCKELALNKIGEALRFRYNKNISFTLNDIFGEFDYAIPLSVIKSTFPKEKGKELSKLVDPDAKSYEKGSIEWVAIREYANIDAQFAELLESKKISSLNPESTVKQRDEFLRKIMEIVFNRLIFLRYRKGEKGELLKTEVGGNTNPRFYFGTQTILQIVDGNPRYLIGLIDDFLKHISYEVHTEKLSRVAPSTQHTLIESTAERLMNKFKSVPLLRGNAEIDIVMTIKTKDHLSKVITDIGNYFKKRINTEKMSTDPPSCFVIDGKSIKDHHLLQQIKMGVYLGAFIALPRHSGELDSYDENLSGERFRLTYLLSPLFNLPIRQYKAISLETCRVQSNDPNTGQLKFD